MTEENEALFMKMQDMKMSNLCRKLRSMMEEPNFALRTSMEVLDELFGHEYDSRKTRKVNRLLSKAHLKYPSATLDDSLNDADRKIDVDLIQRLSKCGWINEKKNLIVTGKAGTGKTYIVNGLAICAIQQGKQVLYTKASLMINELNDCMFTGNYTSSLRKYTEPDLLAIDDFGLMSLDAQKCQQMFEVLDSREGSKSVIVISQVPVKKWYEIFQNNVYADACMSRLVHNAYRLELNGRDMRKPVSKNER